MLESKISMINTYRVQESWVAWKALLREEQSGGVWASQLRTDVSGVRAMSGQQEGWNSVRK